ncbi:MAG: hypothetical protein LBF13_04400 [Campylobacteraceae bacterium]|jgi:uncharacterized Fe-S cluster protein YjdI|nr:hypothetical protein [Campylobacteraceae bacterium]
MKQIFFILLLAGIFIAGCADYEDDPQKLEYSGNIYDCSFKGRDCVDSSYCVVTEAKGTRGTVKCRYVNYFDNGYDSLRFYGTFSSCYFNGAQCEYSPECKKNGIWIECERERY